MWPEESSSAVKPTHASAGGHGSLLRWASPLPHPWTTLPPGVCFSRALLSPPVPLPSDTEGLHPAPWRHLSSKQLSVGPRVPLNSCLLHVHYVIWAHRTKQQDSLNWLIKRNNNIFLETFFTSFQAAFLRVFDWSFSPSLPQQLICDLDNPVAVGPGDDEAPESFHPCQQALESCPISPDAWRHLL